MTEKQMRELLRRFYYHYDLLGRILYDAQDRKLFKMQDWPSSPQGYLSATRQSFEELTAPEVARITRDAIKNSLPPR